MRNFTSSLTLLITSFMILTSAQLSAADLYCDEQLSGDESYEEKAGPRIDDLEAGIHAMQNYIFCYNNGSPFDYVIGGGINNDIEAFLEFIEEKDIFDLDDLPAQAKPTNPIELYSGVEKIIHFFRSLENKQYHGALSELFGLLQKLDRIISHEKRLVKNNMPVLQRISISDEGLKICMINHFKIMGNTAYNYFYKNAKLAPKENRKVISPVLN